MSVEITIAAIYKLKRILQRTIDEAEGEGPGGKAHLDCILQVAIFG